MADGPYRIQTWAGHAYGWHSGASYIVKDGDRVLFDHMQFRRDDAARIRDELNRAYARGGGGCLYDPKMFPLVDDDPANGAYVNAKLVPGQDF